MLSIRSTHDLRGVYRWIRDKNGEGRTASAPAARSTYKGVRVRLLGRADAASPWQPRVPGNIHPAGRLSWPARSSRGVDEVVEHAWRRRQPGSTRSSRGVDEVVDRRRRGRRPLATSTSTRVAEVVYPVAT